MNESMNIYIRLPLQNCPNVGQYSRFGAYGLGSLWQFNRAMENGNLQLIYPVNVVIFHDYFSLLEGNGMFLKPSSYWGTLTNIAIEHGTLMIDLPSYKMVIFHVVFQCLPEGSGIFHKPSSGFGISPYIALKWYRYGPFPAISPYNPIYRMYNHIGITSYD